MDSVVQPVENQPALNPIQLHLLQMFSYMKQDEHLKELKSVLLDFYRRKVDEETAKLWLDYNLSNEKIEQMLHAHDRTSYK
jgi:hypothetical protein